MRDQKTALEYCTFCPKLCRYACPVSDIENTEASTPWGKMSTMYLLDNNFIPWSQENTEQAYKCLDCGLARKLCEKDNPVSETLIEFRGKIFSKGVAPKAVYNVCEGFKKHNNPYSIDLFAKLKKRFPRNFGSLKAKIVYFPGCTAIQYAPEEIETTLKLFEKLGSGDVGLYPEKMQCCGYPLYSAGDREAFKDVVEINFHALQEYGTVIFDDPACLYLMKKVYSDLGFKLKNRLIHVSEFLINLLDTANFRFKDAVIPRPAYHDPCYLGRMLDGYDPPREIITLVCGIEPKEFSRNREKSYCCGGGGIFGDIFPDAAADVANTRLAEFKETGSKLLVTACPTCKIHLKKNAGKGVIVKGLTEYVSDAIC